MPCCPEKYQTSKRKDKSTSCEKCRRLERVTLVPDGRIAQREEVELVQRRDKDEATRNILKTTVDGREIDAGQK